MNTEKYSINSRLEMIVDKLPSTKFQNLGLLHGKLGACILLFKVSELDSYNEHSIFVEDAERLLEEMYEQLAQPGIDMGFGNGLAGIAYGIEKLISEGFVEGKADEILEAVDDRIFQYLAHIDQLPLGFENGVLGYMTYLLPRVKPGNLTINKKREYMAKRLLLELINCLGEAIEGEQLKVEEPALFSLLWELPISLIMLTKVYELGVYTKKIERIFECLSDTVLRIYPQLQSHRLALLTGMTLVNTHMDLQGWAAHMALLKQGIDLEYICNKELKDKNIELGNGIGGVYLFIEKYNQTVKKNEQFFYNRSQFLQRISNSGYWDVEFSEENDSNTIKGFMFGTAGVGLVISDIIDKKDNNRGLFL